MEEQDRTNYILVSGYDQDEIVERVNLNIAEGYIPHGGVAIVQASEGTHLMYVQAMLSMQTHFAVHGTIRDALAATPIGDVFDENVE